MNNLCLTVFNNVKRLPLLCLRMLSVAALSVLIGCGGSSSQFISEPTPWQKLRASWIWDTAQAFQQQRDIFDFAKRQHLGKFFLQIDPDIDAEQYVLFIEQAQRHGIDVYALDGSPVWVDTQPQDFEAFVDWFINFQTLYPLFSGIHADIEPHVLPIWATDHPRLLENYFSQVSQLRSIVDQFNLRLELDIPFWFDDQSFDNALGEGLAAQWLINKADSVTLMAYRNRAQDVIPLVKNELDYANSIGKEVRIALETAESHEGDFLSFYCHTRAELNNAIDVLEDHFLSEPSYEGIAVHSIHSWMAMETTLTTNCQR